MAANADIRFFRRGATLLDAFESLVVDTKRIEGRTELPYFDHFELARAPHRRLPVCERSVRVLVEEHSGAIRGVLTEFGSIAYVQLNAEPGAGPPGFCVLFRFPAIPVLSRRIHGAPLISSEH
jgi:hypothetical protein